VRLWPEQNKAQLLDAGAKTIRAFFGVVSRPRIDEAEVRLDKEPRIRYRVEVNLVSLKLDKPVASAYAVASTDEIKYKYRKYGEERVRQELELMGLEGEEVDKVLRSCRKKRSVRWEKGKRIETTEYYIQNPDIADLENTILRMAVKRASVAATRELPGVDRIFNRPKDWWEQWQKRREAGAPPVPTLPEVEEKAPEAKEEKPAEIKEAERPPVAEERPAAEEAPPEDIPMAEFNARFRELGLSPDEARKVLEVSSLEEWEARGRTRREALEELQRYAESKRRREEYSAF